MIQMINKIIKKSTYAKSRTTRFATLSIRQNFDYLCRIYFGHE